MKIINYLMATLSLATMLACSNHSEIQSPIPTLTNSTNTGCKTSPTLARANNLSGGEGKEYLALKALGEGKMTLEHHNATLACDALIKTQMNTDGSSTIILTEQSTEDTNCTCKYDIQYTISNLVPNKYHVILKKQEINRNGNPLSDATVYKDFYFKYSATLSSIINLK